MADIPKIRFKGFTEPWEQRKLGEVLKERTERAKGDEELLSVTIANGVIRQIDSEKRNTASEDRSNYKIVKKGDVPYNSMRMWQGAVGNSKYNGIVSPAYTILTPTPEANGKFFMELFKKKSTLQIFQRWSQGLTSDTWNLKYPILSSIQFAIPSVEEQEKIAEYFSSLDHLITLHQRKCDDTKELKKYMLQKMFPKNGEKFPEIRFKGFTEAWEQRKLIDVCDYVDYRGKTPTKTDSGVFLVTAKNVKDGYIDYGVSQEYISEDDYEEVMHRGKPEIGDVLITTEAPCGNVAQVNRADIALAQRIIKYRGQSNIVDNTYLKDYLQSPEFQNILNAKSSGGTVKGIKGSILHQQEIKYPKYEEQFKIGSYFNNLDNLITLHQRKCDTLKELKKYMLQNMFPKKG